MSLCVCVLCRGLTRPPVATQCKRPLQRTAEHCTEMTAVAIDSTAECIGEMAASPRRWAQTRARHANRTHTMCCRKCADRTVPIVCVLFMLYEVTKIRHCALLAYRARKRVSVWSRRSLRSASAQVVLPNVTLSLVFVVSLLLWAKLLASATIGNPARLACTSICKFQCVMSLGDE